MRCRNCNKFGLKKIIPIGKQPLSGIFPKKKGIQLKNYSLDLYICKKCQLIQLGKSAAAKEMFGKKYGYQSSISKLMKSHLMNKHMYLHHTVYMKVYESCHRPIL